MTQQKVSTEDQESNSHSTEHAPATASDVIDDSTKMDAAPELAQRPADEAARDLRRDLEVMKTRLDDVVAFQKRKGPWYRDTTLLIAAAAFFVSLVTSGISAYRTYRQDINSREDALHNMVQQYYTTALTNTAMQFSFQKDLSGVADPKWPFVQTFTSSALQISRAATQTYAKQGLSLVNELGNHASAIDLVDLGALLAAANQLGPAEEMLKRATVAAVNVEDQLARGPT
jgi:hypothetical protein